MPANSTNPALPDPATVVEEAKFTPTPPAALGAQPHVGKATTYRVLRTTLTDGYDAPVPDLGNIEAALAAQPALAKPLSDDYHNGDGKGAREAAKLSIGTEAVKNYDDLLALISDLPPDDGMIHHHPTITTKPSSGRVAEEQRNVHVAAFLYAASRESDNDFHLIVGRDVSKTPHQYMTMEISGLPPHDSDTFDTLNTVRNDFKQFFADNKLSLPGTPPNSKKTSGSHHNGAGNATTSINHWAGYDFYDPPIPIEIDGSIFFDVNHATGDHPGPKQDTEVYDNMPTIWEVHPITNITFEP